MMQKEYKLLGIDEDIELELESEGPFEDLNLYKQIYPHIPINK